MNESNCVREPVKMNEPEQLREPLMKSESIHARGPTRPNESGSVRAPRMLSEPVIREYHKRRATSLPHNKYTERNNKLCIPLLYTQEAVTLPT
jgi:hypothetical protein